MENAMIKVRELTKKFGETLAVDRVSFEVTDGEIVGFLGPNGAGKSTTMKMLTCFLPATAGTAEVAGHDVFSASYEVRREIGYMPENVPLYPEMRVREYLTYRAALKRVPFSQRRMRVDEVMEKCWVRDMERKVIGHLSKGYRQRVGLADSLVHNPRILILDEPTAGLDPNQIRQVRQLIRELGREHTILLSTHILPEVEAICERFLIINEGRIAAEGSLNALSRRSGIETEIKGPEKEITAALKKIEGVTQIASSDAGEDYTRYCIDVSGERDARPDVFQAVRQNHWQLRDLHLRTRTLEDLFASITMKEQGHA